jgi:hypothetical protein
LLHQVRDGASRAGKTGVAYYFEGPIRFCCVTLLGICLSGLVGEDAIQMDVEGTVVTFGHDGLDTTPVNFENISATSQTFVSSVTSVDGGESASASLTFSNEPLDSGSFIRLDGAQTKSNGEQTYSYASVYFTLYEAVNYSITGTFILSGTESGDLSSFFAGLYSGDDGSPIFSETDQGLENEHIFVINEANDGDPSRFYVEGQQSGVLGPGTYIFQASAYLIEWDADHEASLDFAGSAQIEFTQVQTEAVPEPAAFTIWTIGAVGCAFAAYRRKRLAA